MACAIGPREEDPSALIARNEGALALLALSASAARLFTVHIITSLGRKFTVAGLDGTIRMDTLKERIYDVGHIPPDRQRLVYGMRQLADDAILADEVPQECTMILILRLRGD